VQFKVLKNGELETRFEGQCAEGDDQTLTYEVELFDETGTPIAKIAGTSDVDEGDELSFRRKTKLPAAAVQRIARYHLTASSAID
jgi:hypothetical protein